jgi:hypothetical protein
LYPFLVGKSFVEGADYGPVESRTGGYGDRR